MNPEIIGIFAKNVFDVAAKVFLERAAESKSKSKIRFTAKEIRAGFVGHLEYVRKWAAEVPSVSFSRSRDFEKAFVNLDLSFIPLRLQSREAPRREMTVSELSHTPNNLVILGEIGAGKTSSLKRLCNDALKENELGSVPRVPILVQFREHRRNDTIAQSILLALGIIPSTLWPKHEEPEETHSDGSHSARDTADPRVQRMINERVVVESMDNVNALVLLDGLDELDPRLLRTTLSELRRLIMKSRRSRFILTCRTSAYQYQLESTTVLEICPLSNSQISAFANNWLGEERATQMLSDIKSKPYQGTEISPLLLSLLCALFERTGQIPGKPRNIYRALTNLLLTEWDVQRSIRRRSQYADFMADRKQEFLARLSYEITTRLGAFQFTHEDLEALYLGHSPSRKHCSARPSDVLALICGYDSAGFSHRPPTPGMTPGRSPSRVPRPRVLRWRGQGLGRG